MNCYICGSETEPRIDPRDMKLRPCSTCEHIISESVEEMERRDEKEKRKARRMAKPDNVEELFDYDDDKYLIDGTFDDEGFDDFYTEYGDEYEIS